MDKDYAFSQNYNYCRSALVLSIRLITLIPREGTETHCLSIAITSFVLLITLIPREGTETTARGKLSYEDSCVDYPYSPRGDGNQNRSGHENFSELVDYPYSPRGDGNKKVLHRGFNARTGTG